MGQYAQASAMDDPPTAAPNVSGNAPPAGQPAPLVVSDQASSTGQGGGRRRRRRRRSAKKGRSRNGGTFVTEIATPLALLGATQYMKYRNARKSLKRRRSRKSYKNRSQKRRRY
jgi:hypothetical protein